MKQSKILLPSENGRNEEAPNKGVKRGILKSLFFMFLLSSVMLFSSCYATVRAPRQPRVRHSVVIMGSDRDYRHDNGKHYGQYKHRERRDGNRDRD